MIFHDQPVLAEAWLARLRLGEVVDQSRDTTVRVSRADLAAALQADDVTSAADVSVKLGNVAGSLLSIIVQMHLAGGAEPSMHKAMMNVYAAWGLTRRFGDGKVLPRSKMTIQRAWNRHRPVAHYWAALEVAKRSDALPSGEFSRSAVFSDPAVFIRFIALAGKFADFGTTFIQKRAQRGPDKGHTLLEASTLVPIPDLSKVS